MQVKKLPQASSWGAAQLYASRVVITSAYSDMLDLTTDDIPEQRDQELLKIIQPLGDDQLNLSETELVQQLGMAGMFWAALHKFTRTPSVPCSDIGSDIGSDIDMSSDADEPMEADDDMGLPSADTDASRPRRIRIQTQWEGYVASDKMQVQSSSPYSSQQSHSSSRLGYIAAAEHTRHAIPEDATVQLASTFLRHALIYSTPQQLNHLNHDAPQLLLQYEGVRRRFRASLACGTFKLIAVPDGEINLLHHLGDRFAQPQSLQSRAVALLECKKRFRCIVDGKPTITDSVLGQITAEALAWRLSEVSAVSSSEFSPQASSSPLILLHFLTTYISTIVVILAVRQYICFLSFHISEAYIGRLQSPDNLSSGDDEYKLNEDWDTISVNATAWHDLGSEEGRLLACKNIQVLI